MSLVDASERLVALPKDESLADSASEDVIVVDELRMRYGATEAVVGINLRVARGEIFACPISAPRTAVGSRLRQLCEVWAGCCGLLPAEPGNPPLGPTLGQADVARRQLRTARLEERAEFVWVSRAGAHAVAIVATDLRL